MVSLNRFALQISLHLLNGNGSILYTIFLLFYIIFITDKNGSNYGVDYFLGEVSIDISFNLFLNISNMTYNTPSFGNFLICSRLCLHIMLSLILSSIYHLVIMLLSERYAPREFCVLLLLPP